MALKKNEEITEKVAKNFPAKDKEGEKTVEKTILTQIAEKRRIKRDNREPLNIISVGKGFTNIRLNKKFIKARIAQKRLERGEKKS